MKIFIVPCFCIFLFACATAPVSNELQINRDANAVTGSAGADWTMKICVTIYFEQFVRVMVKLYQRCQSTEILMAKQHLKQCARQNKVFRLRFVYNSIFGERENIHTMVCVNLKSTGIS